MSNVSRIAGKSQDLVTKAVDSVVDTVRERVPASLEKVAGLVPAPGDVVDQVTATANELLTLSQELQAKVISALKSNA